MPKSMRPVVKLEDAEAKGPVVSVAEGVQEETVAGRAVQRRRVGEAGDADEVRGAALQRGGGALGPGGAAAVRALARASFGCADSRQTRRGPGQEASVCVGLNWGGAGLCAQQGSNRPLLRWGLWCC